MAWGQTKCTQLNDYRAWQRAPGHHIRAQTCSPRTNGNPEHSTFNGKLIFNPARSPPAERSRFLANQHTIKKHVTSTTSPRSRRSWACNKAHGAHRTPANRQAKGAATIHVSRRLIFWLSLEPLQGGRSPICQEPTVRRRPCSRRRWHRGCCRTCRRRPARGRQRRQRRGRRPAWCWGDSPWPAPAYRHR